MATERFGKYELGALLASGGTMEVRRAQPAGGGPGLVVKRAHPHLSADAGFRAAFLEEVGGAAALVHPHIARVIESGDCGGQLFVASEAIDGVALPALSERARALGLWPLPPELATRIVLPLLQALEHAHAQQRVHRDVAPENVLVAFDGAVKLVDFGLAKARLAAKPGAVKTKSRYVSPEQARGREVGAATDVFAAGLVLFELVCGRLPVDGQDAEVIARIATGELDRPREVNPSLDPELEELLLEALAADKAARFGSARALGAALEAWLAKAADRRFELALLVAHLFGREAALPADFLARLEHWVSQRRAPGTSSGAPRSEESGPTSGQPRGPPEASPGGSAPDPAAAPAPPPELGRPARKRRPVWLIGAAVIAVVIGGYAKSVLEDSRRTFDVQVTSEPIDAEVSVDGNPELIRTPVVLNLSAAGTHRIQVTAPGRIPFERTIGPETRSLRAVLPLAPPPPGPPEPVKAAPVDSERIATSEVRPADTVAFDAESAPVTVVLSSTRHSFALSGSTAARLALDPAHRYTVTSEGRFSLESLDPAQVAASLPRVYRNSQTGQPAQQPRLTSNAVIRTLADTPGRAFFFLESPGPARVPAPLGQLGDSPIEVQGAAAIHLFVLTDRSHHDSLGEVTVHARRDDGLESSLRVDAKENAVYVAPDDRFLVRRLDPGATYHLSLEPSGAAPLCQVAAVFSAKPEGFRLDGKPNSEPQRLLPPGRHTVTKAQSVWFTVARLREPDGCEAKVVLAPSSPR